MPGLPIVSLRSQASLRTCGQSLFVERVGKSRAIPSLGLRSMRFPDPVIKDSKKITFLMTFDCVADLRPLFTFY